MTREIATSVLERVVHMRALNKAMGLVLDGLAEMDVNANFSGCLTFINQELKKEMSLIESEMRSCRNESGIANDNN